MSFSKLIASSVALANKLTADLQDPTVTWTPWIGQAGDGAPAYGAPVMGISALIDLNEKQVFTAENQMVTTRATVTFLQPLPDVAPNAGQIRTQPIDPHDVITLPDGTTGPLILISGGLINPDTHRPYMFIVGLGK